MTKLGVESMFQSWAFYFIMLNPKNDSFQVAENMNKFTFFPHLTYIYIYVNNHMFIHTYTGLGSEDTAVK